MYVRHLSVADFRSWTSAELALEPGPTVLVGSNGQGKTNLIEALGYVATLSSHRVPTDAPLVRAGAERAIVGTAAFRDVDFLDDIVATHGSRIVVSVDVKDGMIATSGWTQTTELPAGDAIRRLTARGVRSFVYTDVSRDGRLTGPELDGVRQVADAVRGKFLYSGGIGSLDHLRALARLRQVNLAGVIAGKALYEKKFTLAEGQAALDLH